MFKQIPNKEPVLKIKVKRNISRIQNLEAVPTITRLYHHTSYVAVTNVVLVIMPFANFYQSELQGK